MPSNDFPSTAADIHAGTRDLGPLAWVLDELRKSLDASAKALKRFVRDADAARGSDLASVDAGQLRIARQQLHQAVGALEMVGLAEPALLLRAMEAAVQRFLQQPETCTPDAAAKIERASFALTEYLDGLLANRHISAIALFPQYRELRELIRADRIHPADLWDHEWRWLEPKLAVSVPAQQYSPESRKVLDQCSLQLMRGKAPRSARELSDLCLGLAAGQADSQARAFWTLSAAVFEALALDLLPSDLYVKRLASRVLIQYTSLSKSNSAISERLALDLLFFCAQAAPAPLQTAPVLRSVRASFGLSDCVPTDYETVQFGRFDPALLSQARKRITSAKEMWSSFSAGDRSKSKALVDQFGLVADSLTKLHAPSEPLAQALNRAVDTAISSGSVPRVELAMEVATSVLYLEAAFEDLDPNDPQMTLRMANLADRLEGVRAGGMPQPLQSWMEELYRRVSDKQTMGSVVDELRTSLGELEASLDVFFRDPQNKAALGTVPRQLAQMRGVLSVLGLDQASQAVLRMRDAVESMLTSELSAPSQTSAATFDQLGNNLGALSFLIDMLNYQPALAKQLFVYDDEKGELKPLMGRVNKSAAQPPASVDQPDALSDEIRSLVHDAGTGAAGAALTERLDQLATEAELADQNTMAKTAQVAAVAYASNNAVEASEALSELALSLTPEPAPASPILSKPEPELEEDDLQDIFLEEAREVVATGQSAVVLLRNEPSSAAHLTVLRRAFHTLKGSGRMVGLTEFGEAAWALEQLLNSWLADQHVASDEFIAFCADALNRFKQWADDIEANRADDWSAEPFRSSADALRLRGQSELVEAVTAPLAAVIASDTLTVDGADASTLEMTAQASTFVSEPEHVANLQVNSPVAVEPPSFAFEAFDIEFVDEPVSAESSVEVTTIESAMPTSSPVLPPVEATESAFTFTLEPDAAHHVDTVRLEDPAVTESALVDQAPEPAAANGFHDDQGEDIELDISASMAIELSDVDFLEHFPSAVDVQTPERPIAANPESDVLSARWSDSSIDVLFEPTPDLNPTAPESAGAGADALLEAAVQTHDEPFAAAALKASSLLPPASSHDELEQVDEEQIKVIGSLRIGIPLYNVYLNEADEWSRRLATEVAEWVIDAHLPVNESTVALAHSLAGSSATVGFHGLSDMARSLESALDHSRVRHVPGVARHGQIFVDATEDIRRLLHQFAAGFLKEPDTALLEQLRQLDYDDALFSAKAEAIDEALDEATDEALDIPLDDLPDARAEQVSTATYEAVAKPNVAEPTASAPVISTAAVVTAAVLPIAPFMVASAPAMSVMSVMSVMSAIPEPTTSFQRAGFDVAELDDDIDAVDAIDVDLFPIFEEEALELLPKLGGAMRQWVARPDNQSARMEVLHVLHTLKGSARLAGALRLGEIAHRMESDIDYLGSGVTNAKELEPLLGRLDAIEVNFDGLRHPEPQVFGSSPLSTALQTAKPAAIATSTPVAIAPSEPQTQTRSPAVPPPALSVVIAPAPELLHEITAELVPAKVVEAGAAAAPKINIPGPQAMALQPLRQSSTASIRVRSQLLDRMVNQAGEVMITRSRLEAELGQLRSALGDMSGNLDRLRQQLRDIEVQAESQMQSRLAQAKETQASFDPLEFDRFTRVQELTRMMAESVNDVATVQRTLQRTVDATEDDLVAQGRQTRELQRDLLRTRMVEFEGISDRLYRVVRQASKDTGKQVKLDLLGGTIEMDRGMLDRMTPAFEHLLRNCVAHGIESPQGREKAGKDPVGLITVHLKQEGNDVSVDFSDDGNGLDLARIRDKALGLGLIQPGQVVDDKEASSLIFLPGFTTAQQVTELAGRGIGMDVVRSEVNALGGRIETATTAGQGTHFKLVLPLTTAVTQVVMVRAGSLSVGVPANVVETVRRVSAAELAQAYASGSLRVGDEDIAFFWSGALLQASRHSTEVPGKTTQVVIFRSAAQRVALHVDEVVGNREVVVKNLGPQLSRLPGLAGMSVLASGAVVLIYNPVAMAAVYGQQARTLNADLAVVPQTDGGPEQPKAPVPMSEAPQAPLVLVVDDSITVRRVTQRLLQREGYRVVMAADGLQALERLQGERPVVVLSDIEMPRMDGFDLARNIRADVRLAGLPIVMITSRIAEKHREHAMSLGVDHYLGKPYSEEELMGLVRHYCAAEAAVSA